jgi:outer membrane protein OmpA-like peptidoglycan-associated protein
VLASASASAFADPTSGIDAALERSSYDANGLFELEGARLMPAHDLSFKLNVDYAHSPLVVAVPGIGTGPERVLDQLITIDMAFGMSLSDRVAIGLDVAGYRTSLGPGFGTQGYEQMGVVLKPSTGVLSLRPLTNIDPGRQGDELAGPLDARFGVKLALYRTPYLALAAIGSVFLPFGDEDVLLGDRSLVFEPKLAGEWRPDRSHATRVVANVAARIRERSVLQAYDTQDPTATANDARAYLDVGSELVVGLGALYELTPRVSIAAEVQAFIPLPAALSYGSCELYSGAPCSSLSASGYWQGAKYGDFTTLATLGAMLRVSSDVTADVAVGTGRGGARAADAIATVGLVWAPQPAGSRRPGAHDRDGDGIPDELDACPDEPEDRDGFQDEDGCPDPDNDGDGIPDAKDKCPNEPEDRDGFQDEDGCPDPDNDGDGIPDASDKCPNDPEDKDGFEDADGCPDLDNDHDGIPDAKDKCPNDPETFNGFEDEDGCPDVLQTSGPEERADRIDLKGAAISFGKDGKLTPAAKHVLVQVAAIIKQHKLLVRVEVHVPLGTRSTTPAAVADQKRKDKELAQRRAQDILDALLADGVTIQQLQAVAIGSDRPLGTTNPSDPLNERVDFIKAQQGATP